MSVNRVTWGQVLIDGLLGVSLGILRFPLYLPLCVTLLFGKWTGGVARRPEGQLTMETSEQYPGADYINVPKFRKGYSPR